MTAERALGMDELKEIEKAMLVRLDDICREHGLRYSIAYGTLLGAMRHGGFIPWDDDVDIVMPRPDYEKLLALRFSDGKYRILDYRNERHYYYPYAKMIDTRTTLIEHYRVDRPMGVFIDIFPMDLFRNEKEYADSYDERMKDRNALFRNGFKISRQTTPGLGLRFARRTRRILIAPFRKGILRRTEEKYIADPARAAEYRTCGFAFSMWKRDVYPKTLWDSLTRIPFEDITVSAFADTEAYLTRAFRDWRAFPPEEERVPDHDFEAYRTVAE